MCVKRHPGPDSQWKYTVTIISLCSTTRSHLVKRYTFLPQEDSGTTSDYGSREGEVEEDLVVEEDPEKIRKAGNDLFNAENIEGALEKYKEAIACGERGSQMSPESLSKTYRWPEFKDRTQRMIKYIFSNIAHCYNKKKKYVESIEASFNSMEANKAFVRPYLRFCFFFFNKCETVVFQISVTPPLQGGAQLQDAGELRHVRSCPDEGQGHADH